MVACGSFEYTLLLVFISVFCIDICFILFKHAQKILLVFKKIRYLTDRLFPMRFLLVLPKNLKEPVFDLVEDAKKIKNCPNSVIYASGIISYSAIIQFVSDIFLETASFFNFPPLLPIRPAFLVLTAISALQSYQTLRGIRRRELDVTQDSVQVGIVVESGLIFEDLYFIYNYPDINPIMIISRTPFLILTSLNVILFVYIMTRLQLFKFNFIKRIIYLAQRFFYKIFKHKTK